MVLEASMLARVLAFAAFTCILAAPACDETTKQECSALLGTMKPLDVGTPSSQTVDGVSKQVQALKFQNQPLGVYATNYVKTLAVLSGTLKLKEGSSPPDGTDAVIAENLKHARTDRDDVQRFCSK